jgi:hypothetical protein
MKNCYFLLFLSSLRIGQQQPTIKCLLEAVAEDDAAVEDACPRGRHYTPPLLPKPATGSAFDPTFFLPFLLSFLPFRIEVTFLLLRKTTVARNAGERPISFH